MINTISSSEAFAAMQSGKTVLCRSIGGLLDFDELKQFPATVFFTGDHEFCIKIEMINVAGIEFTKPLTLDEYQEGQDVFVINTYTPSIYAVSFKTTALLESINSGFVQRDEENAKLQLKALSKVLGFNLDSNLSVVRLGEESKKASSKRKTKLADKQSDKIEDYSQNIDVAQSINEVNQVRQDVINDQTLNQKNSTILNGQAHQKIDELSKQKPKLTIAEQGPIHVVEDSLVNNSSIENNEEENYKKLLEDLINRANKAKTANEANALVRYTRAWTEEQRKPLIKAINARLVELNDKNKLTNSEPPSLMVQIQTAVDLTELDALEIDVAGRHPDIQPKLMSYVLKRRKELEAVS